MGLNFTIMDSYLYIFLFSHVHGKWKNYADSETLPHFQVGHKRWKEERVIDEY